MSLFGCGNESSCPEYIYSPFCILSRNFLTLLHNVSRELVASLSQHKLLRGNSYQSGIQSIGNFRRCNEQKTFGVCECDRPAWTGYGLCLHESCKAEISCNLAFICTPTNSKVGVMNQLREQAAEEVDMELDFNVQNKFVKMFTVSSVIQNWELLSVQLGLTRQRKSIRLTLASPHTARIADSVPSSPDLAITLRIFPLPLVVTQN